MVGASCRLPGGINGLDALWTALMGGRDLVGVAPPDRFDAQRWLSANPRRSGKSYTVAGAFLADVAGFDADYFQISPREAAQMDPQHRLLLELAVEALDDAGAVTRSLAGTDTGVFVSVGGHSYATLQAMRPKLMDSHSALGIMTSFAANRISFHFDLRGPSVVVESACSSSLVALHQACEALHRGRVGMAVAGGANLLLAPTDFVASSRATMLSRRGRSQTFSAAADGYVRGEGGGLVVLKRLADALLDGDRVHALIRGTATNNDGHTPGISVPDAGAQRALLEQVYRRAGVDPGDVVYLETHGTGTPVGDPIECRALGMAMGRSRGVADPLPIGSIKTNVGHLEGASGIAGLLKAMLVLRHGAIPASLHATPLSKAIDFTALGLEPVLTARPLEVTARSLVGVNSFGAGGSNAHAILAAPPSAPPAPAEATGHGDVPVVVSARTRDALAEASERMVRHLEGLDERDFYHLAATSARRRERHPYRAVVLAGSARQAAGRLKALAEHSPASRAAATARGVSRGEVAFAFSGNGAQWAGMGADLLDSDAVFAAAVARVDALLTPALGWSVEQELRAAKAESSAATEVAQPLLFTVQVATVCVLAERGFRPKAVIGHSVGEVAAAWAAGALDLATACRVVAERSRAQGPTAGLGRMAAIGVGGEQARRLLAPYEGRLEVTAFNSDRDLTVGGPLDALEELGDEAARRGVFFRLLDLDYAFHTAAMDGIRDGLLAALEGVEARATDTAFASTVTGSLVDTRTLGADYWWDNVRQPVRFASAVQELLAAGCDTFVEVGPHHVLRGYLTRLCAAVPGQTAVIPTLFRDGDGPAALDTALAHLLAVGADVAGEEWFPRPARVVDLPAYPWQHERHWHGAPGWWDQRLALGSTGHPLLGERIPGPEPGWECDVEPERVPWAGDHTISESVVMPGMAFAEMALAAGAEVFGVPIEVLGLRIDSALTLPWQDDAMDVRLRTSFSPDDGVTQISSTDGDGSSWQAHARAQVRRLLRPRPGPLAPAPSPETSAGKRAAEAHYARCAEAGLSYGPLLRVLHDLRATADTVTARYALPPCDDTAFHAHPVVMDAALQAALALLPDDGRIYVPVSAGAIRCWDAPDAVGLIDVRARAVTSDEGVVDVTVTDLRGAVALEMTEVRLKALDERSRRPTEYYTTELRAVPLAAVPAPAIAASELARATRAERQALPRGWRDSRENGLAARTGELSGHFFAQAVQDMLPGEQEFSLGRLLAAGLRPDRQLWVRSLARMACDAGVMTALGGGAENPSWRLVAPPRPAAVLQKTTADFPAEAAFLTLCTLCGSHLAPMLRGDLDPVDLMFNGADRDLIEQVYSSTVPSRPARQNAGIYLRAFLARWPADRPLHVLEVGGGTGGTTASLLPLLPPERTRYVFTDVSAGFFTRAQERFTAYDFVEYRTLDITADPVAQGFAEGEFDLVIAANVLHVAPRLTQALHHVASLLGDRGALLAVEASDPRLDDLCFGGFDGFWQFTDAPLRTQSCLLTADQWMPLLAECGFTDATYATQDLDVDDADDSVILATRTALDTTSVTATPVVRSAARWLVVAERPEAELTGRLVDALRVSGSPEVAVVSAGDSSRVEWPWSDGERSSGVVVLLDEVASGAWAGESPRWVGGPPQSGEPPQDEVPPRDEEPSWVGQPPRPASPDQELVSSPDQDLIDPMLRRAAMLRDLVAARHRDPSPDPLPLVVVTRPSGALPAPERPLVPSDAAVWGMARSLANEEPSLRIRRVSLDRGSDAAHDAARLAQVINADTAEDELVLTRGGCFAPRTTARLPTAPAAASGPYRLHAERGGGAAALSWIQDTEGAPASGRGTGPGPGPGPGPGQIVIAVEAAALNYHDVMTVTGLITEDADTPGFEHDRVGLECAGTVTGVGTGVTGFAPGDRVFAFTTTSIASRMTTPAHLAGHIPDGMSFAEAATLPIAFATVHYSLTDRANLQPGETVLVHGGAGGIGLAVLQHAQHVGAQVIATAGTPAKRRLLRHLGVTHVLDSRGPDFAEQVHRLTDDEGVDVVVNSLTGEAAARSLELLRPGGRFVELGKRGFQDNSRLLLKALAANCSYLAVDILKIVAGPLRRARRLTEAVSDLVRRGAYRPLPHSIHPAAQLQEAFTLFQHSRHVGKVVLSLEERPPVRSAPAPLRLNPHGTYLITGGLNGFGAATARHLATLGARHLTLVGRRGDSTRESAALLTDLRAQGVDVSVHAADVTDAAALRTVIDSAPLRLRGVVHAAMELNDTLLRDSTDAAFRAALPAKAKGAHLLDTLTRRHDLDLFVLYSSTSSLLGWPGQANYNAANVYTEALARARREVGLPALAVGWGAITQVGYAARTYTDEYLGRQITTPLTPTAALESLALLTHSTVDVATVVAHVDWHRVRTATVAGDVPRHAHVLAAVPEHTDDSHTLREQITALDPPQAETLVRDTLTELLARLLRTPTERIDQSIALKNLGIDSLLATELTTTIRRNLNCELATVAVINATGTDHLARILLPQLMAPNGARREVDS
ncbi:type I polyketide synthase [Streptomyces sp. AN091965]|uniref:type I polyketide synthase n=1 Tax=Streptomyces sp. AN091965 TaxID=2927803 RepID=UPI001F617D48|nr:type I polyketide synthase [Streptomyces sp. AN091965]MCI3928054.1 SDR family NAD(P)-dependent oxidoreductase [Streptomyces sp. AN091965]